MSRLARRIGDKRLLGSPLLANLLLDDLDQLLESRGHRFCRYADDCNTYVRSLAAGQRVMQSVTRFGTCLLACPRQRKRASVSSSTGAWF